MKKLVTLTFTLLLICTASAFGQAEVDIDTLTVIKVDTFPAIPNDVELYSLRTTNGDTLVFTEYVGYIWYVGIIENGDSVFLDEPRAWFKSDNPTIGDQWTGFLPVGWELYTYEEITGFGSVTTGAGTFNAWEISMWGPDSVYLGLKWFANDVGLLGWSFDICNETYDMELLDYDIVGGSGYWPMAIGNLFVYYSEWDFSSTTAPIASITVDGNSSDWYGISPVIQDPQGDDTTGSDGVDIRDLYAATDGTNLYLMANFWDGPPDSGWALWDPWAYTFVIDEDAARWDMGVGYETVPTSHWNLSSSIIDLTGAEVACSEVIEISIPLANLGGYAWELPGLRMQIGDVGEYDYSCFNTVPIPVVTCPITTPGDLNSTADVTGSDVITLVNYVFKAGPDPQPCPAAADMNCSGDVTGSDIITLVNYVFKAGPLPCDVCPLIPGTWTCP